MRKSPIYIISSPSIRMTVMTECLNGRDLRIKR